MAVEYLQGELQRVRKTLDLQESLVNGCDQEILDGCWLSGKSPRVFISTLLNKLPNLILYLFRRGRRAIPATVWTNILHCFGAFLQKVHS